LENHLFKATGLMNTMLKNISSVCCFSSAATIHFKHVKKHIEGQLLNGTSQKEAEEIAENKI